IWCVDGIEVRTFCTCRHGEIWNIPIGRLFALSGRADGAPTSFSNFGLLARFSGAWFPEGERIWARLAGRALRAGVATYEPLASFLGARQRSEAVRVEVRPWFPSGRFAPGRIIDVAGAPLHRILSQALAN